MTTHTITEHDVYVEALGVKESDAEALSGLQDLALAIDELLGPVISSSPGRHAIGLTVTIESSTADAARAVAGAALGRILVAAGLVDAWTVVAGRQAVIA